VKARDAAIARWWSWWGAYQRQLDRDAALEARHMRDAYTSGWQAGAAFALKTSAELAGLAPTLDLFNQLLAAELLDRVNDQEVDGVPDDFLREGVIAPK